MFDVDYIIVGQGIAGTTLAQQFIQHGRRVLLIDAPQQRATSEVAAGLMNPITGRFFARTWQVDTLFPYARRFYAQLQEQLQQSFFYPHPILRALNDERAQQRWDKKARKKAYQPYIGDTTTFQEDLNQHFLHFQNWVALKNGGRVHLRTLLQAYKEWWQKQGFPYLEAHFIYNDLTLHATHVQYKEYNAQGIIFCEGYRAAQNNPFFPNLPFDLTKGEVLLVRIPQYPHALTQCLLKHDVFIVPWEDDLFWIGSNYSHDFSHEHPTVEKGEALALRLKDKLKLDFEVIDHQAAIRPTVRDHRPLLGAHHTHKHVYLFNGLGTKGSTLAPYYAAQLFEHITLQKPLDEAVYWQRTC